MANYTYPGTLTVKNRLGAKTHEELERLEGSFVAARAIEIALGFGPQGHFDAEHLKAIHGYLFQDVYEWAGHTRDEQVALSDGTIATEPAMRKEGGGDFMIGRFIPEALDTVVSNIRDTNYLRGLAREDFATHAAGTIADINAIHPFREGNGRTQRVFMQELAKQAGHTLDFSVVSKERMVQASISANEGSDPSMMRRLFDEISNPKRTEALREAVDFLDHHDFNWNDRYIATMASGHLVNVTMVGLSGDHFMARTQSEILIGNSADLPEPRPQGGEDFEFIASEDSWNEGEKQRGDQQQESSPQESATDAPRQAQKDAGELESRATSDEMTDAKQERLNRLLNTLSREDTDKDRSNATERGRSRDDDDGGGDI